MKSSLPLCCATGSFRLLSRQISSIESPDALVNGAVAIALHQMKDVKAADVNAQLQAMADTVRSRVRGRQPQALLAHLHGYLFDELGFVGDTENYYSTANSFLPSVLRNRRGLPITLSLIYKTVAARVGMKSWGVALPGHFLVGVDAGDGPMLVDAFARGRILTPDEAHDRLEEIFGEEVEWSSDLLQPASNRHWLTRMLQNLLANFGAGERYADVAAMLELEMLLWPDESRLQRDLALVLARCGMSEQAGVWLNRYLKNNPDDPQELDLKQLLEVLTA
jgi:regulator of sirC expression with transglutaminase-like and TPR domain